MSSPVSRKIKVLQAKYIKEAESILIHGEGSDGEINAQIHRNSFYFGERSEEEIEAEMIKTAGLMIGKKINMIFNDSIKDYDGIKEPISREKRIEENINLIFGKE